MCHKPARSKPERRPEQAAQPRRKPAGTWENTSPRGNPESDRRDLERSLERLEMLVGR